MKLSDFADLEMTIRLPLYFTNHPAGYSIILSIVLYMEEMLAKY